MKGGRNASSSIAAKLNATAKATAESRHCSNKIVTVASTAAAVRRTPCSSTTASIATAAAAKAAAAKAAASADAYVAEASSNGSYLQNSNAR